MKLRYATSLTGLALGAVVLVGCGERAASGEAEVPFFAPASVAGRLRPESAAEKLVAPATRGAGAVPLPEPPRSGPTDADRPVPVPAPAGVKAAARDQPVPLATPGAPRAAQAEAAPAVGGAATSTGARPVEAAPAELERKVIRTATLNLVVREIAPSVARVQALVAGIPGAYISSTKIQPDKPRRISSLTLRVPAGQLDGAMASLRAIGASVINEDVGSRDVTAQFTDLSAQLRNAQATEQQLLAIMVRADKVEDIIRVQRELTQLRERIEVLQGQLNLLTSQTDFSTITVNLHPAPDLSVKKESATAARMHDEVSLGIQVTNDGTVDVEQVEIRDKLDPGMIFVAASDGGIYRAATHEIVWTLDDLGAGDTRTLSETVRLEGDGRDMTTTTQLSTASPERDPKNNTVTTVTTFHVDLRVEKQGSVAVPVGRDAEYAIAYANAGTADAHDVRIVEQLADGMTFVRASGGGHYDRALNAVVWELPRLQPDARDNVSYVARVDRSEGRLQTTTTIGAAQPDRAEIDNSATTFFTALPEEVANRDVWTPGNTARDSVDALSAIGQWIVDAAIQVGVIGGPILGALLVVVTPWVIVRRRRRARALAAAAGRPPETR